MATQHRSQLRDIRTFPALVAYLRDEMGWPIDSADFEELTFDYTPEELGIDPASAAKIQEIKRLRPLTTNQPWGIFFVKFEPKNLPVVALRRILSRVVLKKRASANSSERAAWEVDDLLFVSNFGQGEQRQISFAHFSQEGAKGELPTLKVLGWDSSDTPLKLDEVSDKLTDNLAWPADEADLATWRTAWRSAFTLQHGEVITTSKALAIRLAELARSIRDRVTTVLEIETSDGPVTGLMSAFRKALIHDLDADGFADMYAQTIAYGLLCARIEDPGSDSADGLAAHMRTSPFLKELMASFLGAGGQTNREVGSAIDFDELGVRDVVALLDAANMEAVVRDFGDTNPLEDPVIHFYELFLKEYDPRKRMQRGVFYTPRPVVTYIVRSVHEVLQTEFGLADGLADTATWSEVAKRHQGLAVPEGVRPTAPFVTVLDPATGTGTFLVEVIDVVHRTLCEKWTREGHGDQEILDLWNDYVPQQLLPRLHGYELLMAPYAIAHLKIGLKLHETGYRFENEERARIYLTNALEPTRDFSGKLAFAIPALAHEAAAVNEIKGETRFTVVIGNPPYSSAAGSNKSSFVTGLMKPYMEGLGVENERKKGALQDEYVRFFALSQHNLGLSGTGILALITNNSMLDGTLHRAMRQSLIDSFDTLKILNLHGSSRVGEAGIQDENVFDIMQGVAVTLGVRLRGPSAKDGTSTEYAELRGTRESKYRHLAQPGSDHEPISPALPYFLLKPLDLELFEEYASFASVADIFDVYSSGIETEKDHFAVAFSANELRARLEAFSDASTSDEAVASAFGLKSTPNWNVGESRRALMQDGIDTEKLVPFVFHCFDRRYTYYSKQIITRPRFPVMRNMGKENVALVSLRQVKGEPWAHAFVTRAISNKFTLSSKSSNVSYHFPLLASSFPESTESTQLFPSPPRVNLKPLFRKQLEVLERDEAPPVQLLGYLYSVLYSARFRSRYGEYLRLDFPRVPISANPQLFGELAQLGQELVALHLLEAPAQQALSARYDDAAGAWRYEVDKGQNLPITLSFCGPAEPVVTKVGWSDSSVWLDAGRPIKGTKAEGTIGFRGVPEEVWNARIGGYQVCEKWLKDRGPKRGQPGRALTVDDVTHYHRIVIALHETLRIMGEIDQVIDAYGGWPAAFNPGSANREAV